MVSAQHIISIGLLVGSVTAHPAPFDIGRPLNNLEDKAENFVDEAKDALFPSTISGTLAPDLLPDILYFAEYSAAAYCDPNHVPGTEVSCPDNICPTVQNNTVTTIIEFSEGDSDTTGILALDHTKGSIVLSFRGSHSVRNWIANLAASLDPIAWCKDCEIHHGFYQAYLSKSTSILTAITELRTQNPSYRIVTTGHSLGGALAQIAAADLRRKGVTNVAAYTYGSPRIGNDRFSAFVSAGGENFRVTHADDPVPRLPLISMGYQHVSPEYHVARGSVGAIMAEDIDVLEGGVNFGGNTGDGGLVSLNVPAHLEYLIMEDISECASGGFEI